MVVEHRDETQIPNRHLKPRVGVAHIGINTSACQASRNIVELRNSGVNELKKQLASIRPAVAVEGDVGRIGRLRDRYFERLGALLKNVSAVQVDRLKAAWQ
ncbi:hypothetical protein BN1723_012974 [Verticillium longisporum]|uniref:Uncharacterized protein n=1 Tax=Verticillium longisporum TaxID=100787 RepID=A0A0G4LP45_VERLO|nr:hypothetical protein BN1723_012974 [Verticillium longisporum]